MRPSLAPLLLLATLAVLKVSKVFAAHSSQLPAQEEVFAEKLEERSAEWARSVIAEDEAAALRLLQIKGQRSLGVTLKDSPDTPGWLVERIYHAHPIICPWQQPGDAPDADCLARQGRIAAMRDAISTCRSPLRRSDKAIGHRGAPLVAPEETVASWEIGAASGAGWLECDASLTGSMDLVCRHGTCDLAFTTDIVANHPELHKKCSKPWVPGSGEPAVCCTYDFTTAELQGLCAIMESKTNPSADSVDGYILGPPGFRSGAVAKKQCHKVVSYAEYLKLMKDNGYLAIPELKDTMEKGLVAFLHRQGKDIYWLAEKFADELMASFGPGECMAQTFDHLVAAHWKKTRPSLMVEYMWEALPAPGQNCSNRKGTEYRGDCGGPELLRHLSGLGVDMFSPPIQLLIANGPGHTMVPAETAVMLKGMKVKSIGSWSLERQGCDTLADHGSPMTPEIQAAEWAPCGVVQGGGGYYDSVEGRSAFQHADVLDVLDVLFKQVGLAALFSDWPATVAAYANCVLDSS